MNHKKPLPLVSVVIPTIKFDDYTEIAIKSIVNQSYENWEIILVLDGALPKSIPNWVLEHGKIKLVVHKNRLGTPVSLNDGVKASSGELIARLDADDIAHPDRISNQVDFMQTNTQVVCVGTSTLIIDENGNYLSDLPKPKEKLDLRELLLERNQLVHSSVMYRKKNFEAIDGYNPIMTRSQDYDLYLRLAHTGPIGFLDKPLCAYRVHLGQHSRKTSPFSRYTLEILKQRNRLGKLLSTPLYEQQYKNFIWYVSQIIRYAGLRKPRYLKGNPTMENIPSTQMWMKDTKLNS